jgi:hypothetical protein
LQQLFFLKGQAMQRKEALAQQQNGKVKGHQVQADGLHFLEDFQVSLY